MLLTDIKALLRSLRIYRFNRSHRTSLEQLYRPFVRPANLVFDIGAHAGDRTACFNSLGARVVCVEPQTLFTWFLKLTNLVHPRVTVLSNVVSETNGPKILKVNSRNPTVSTLSDSFVQAANAGATGWEGQVWDRSITVQSVTLDHLIERFGVPDFIKIDVEGAELGVLKGMSRILEDRPKLFIELHGNFFKAPEELVRPVFQLLEPLGYVAYNPYLRKNQSADEFLIDTGFTGALGKPNPLSKQGHGHLMFVA
jgi:FkbM family methyltransferase